MAGCSQEDWFDIQDMLQGGNKGFLSLYTRYEKRLHCYLLRNDYGDPGQCDAEYVVNETFYSFYKGIHGFRGECQVYTWLCAIARNRYSECLKSSKKKRQLFNDNVSEGIDNMNEKIKNMPPNEISKIEKQLCLEACIDKLLEMLSVDNTFAKCLEALTLVALGKTNKEIARQTGRASAGASKVFNKSCRDKFSDQHPLRRCLKDCLDLEQ